MNFIRIIFWNLPSVKLDNSRTRSVIITVFIFAFRIKRLDSSIPSCTPRFQPFAFIYLISGIRRIKKRKSTNTYIIISVCPVPFFSFSLRIRCPKQPVSINFCTVYASKSSPVRQKENRLL